MGCLIFTDHFPQKSPIITKDTNANGRVPRCTRGLRCVEIYSRITHSTPSVLPGNFSFFALCCSVLQRRTQTEECQNALEDCAASETTRGMPYIYRSFSAKEPYNNQRHKHKRKSVKVHSMIALRRNLLGDCLLDTLPTRCNTLQQHCNIRHED